MITVTGTAYARFRAPDLDRMERFLGDFGLLLAERTSDRLTMRSTDGGHVTHVTERGEPAHVGFALEVETSGRPSVTSRPARYGKGPRGPLAGPSALPLPTRRCIS
jgi:hypothetical protein